MDEHEWLAEQFEGYRTHLRAVAYRMLGSVSEADDAVQESWLRLSRSDTSGVDNLGGWVTTVVARVCLDMLRTRESRHEEPLDEHVLDPIVSREDGIDPEHEALLADSVGLALLVVLETLEPAERLAFVLHDLFAVPFDEIATVLDRSPAAARQLASRARRRVQARPRPRTPTARRSGECWTPSSPLPADARVVADGPEQAERDDAHEQAGADRALPRLLGRLRAEPGPRAQPRAVRGQDRPEAEGQRTGDVEHVVADAVPHEAVEQPV